jgi:hypothetical protein
MNNIFDELMNRLLDENRDMVVEDYVIGTGMTAVKLADGRVGVAHLFREELPGGCMIFDDLLPSPVGVREFVKLAELYHPVTVSLALATVNAVYNYIQRQNETEEDIFSLARLTKDDVVGFVGDFRPLTESLKDKVKELMIFERMVDNRYFPDWAAPWKIKECDVAIITGTTIMNKTLDTLLNSVNTDRVFIFGPSTTLLPEVYPECVKAIGGTRIIDGNKAMNIASKAGGTKNLYRMNAAKKITVRIH